MARQIFFLMKIFLLLKSWRLLLIIPIIAIFLIGIELGHSVANRFMWRYVKNHTMYMTASTFLKSKAKIYGILASPSEVQSFEALSRLLASLTGTDNHSFLIPCSSKSSCFNKMHSSILIDDDHMHPYHIDFSKSMALCQVSYTSLSHCAFLGSIAALAQAGTNDSSRLYGNLEVFQWVSLPDGANKGISRCKRTKSFFVTLPQILVVELGLATAIVCSYVLIGTVSCIDELKSRGFLQLMMRKGLSPFTYWVTVWTWTGFELLLFSASLTTSFSVQCPGLYSVNRILFSFLITSTYLFCMTAFILALTVITNNYYIIYRCTFAYMIVSIVSMLANRLVHDLSTMSLSSTLKTVLLLLPCSNVAEQLYANLVGQVDSRFESNLYTAGLIVNGTALTLIFVITLYLDHVLKTGNALCYPACYLFRRVPGDEAKPEGNYPRPSVERLDQTVFVQVAGVSLGCGNSATYNKDGISVDIYDSQIAVVYNEDGNYAEAFMNALTGRQQVRSGHVWIDGHMASNPMARPYAYTRLGECLQEDTLCFRLTVINSLKMALISSGNAWTDCEGEINRMLTLLRLVDKLPCTVGSLSNGQRRKLCIALALLGNPRLVVLHDPTRGLDPLSRLRMWRLLQAYRSGRCIVLCTERIDEADVFSDRKIFLSPLADSVICAGSSQFIRRGANFDLVVQATLLDKDQVIERLRVDLPSKVRTSINNSLLSLALPSANDSLLAKVVNALKSLGTDVSSISLLQSRLSDVYQLLKSLDAAQTDILFTHSDLHVSSNVEEIAPNDPQTTQPAGVSPVTDNFQHDNEALRVEKSTTFCPTTFWVIFLFNCILFRRNYKNMFLRILITLAIICLHASMLIMERNITAGKESATWIKNFNFPAPGFSRGLCIADSDAPYAHQLDNRLCGIVFTGALTVGNSFLVLKKSSRIPLHLYLLQPNLTRFLYNHCSISAPTVLACPIVYANSWYNLGPNNLRKVSIGSFSPFKRYEPGYSATTVYKAFIAVTAYFLGDKTVSHFITRAFVDFRHARIYLYGVPAQMFIFTVLPSLFLDDIISHGAYKWRQHLTTIGISPASYWASTFVFHWLQYVLLYLLTVAISIGINPTVYMAKYQLYVSAIIGGFGIVSNLMIAYFFSIIFTRSRRLLIAANPALSICISALNLLGQFFPDSVNAVLIMSVPPFALVAMPYYATKYYVYATELNSIGSDVGLPLIDANSIFKQWEINLCLKAIPIQAAVLILLFVAALKLGLLCPCSKCASHSNTDEYQYIRGDDLKVQVAPEAGEQGATTSASLESTIQLQNLRMTYSNNADAVRDLTFSVKSGETFGIVGPNGSGMTVAIQAIIGKERPTSGECQVKKGNSWVRGSQIWSSQLIAFSPQCMGLLFDALTIGEHLLYYAQMLGAPRGAADQLLLDIGLYQCKDTRTGLLSEGLKRRLSVAIALLSGSPLLVIDDPSTGMTPEDEAQIWRLISKSSQRYLSAVISSHSLTGAELLGCRVALINHGLLAFLGTVQQLKKRFGIYILEIELTRTTEDEAIEKKASILKAIIGRFFSSEILDQTLTRMTISIPEQNAGPQYESLRWLLQLREYHGLEKLEFYPATSDQLLQILFKDHDAFAQKKHEAAVNEDALPIAPFNEQYDV